LVTLSIVVVVVFIVYLFAVESLRCVERLNESRRVANEQSVARCTGQHTDHGQPYVRRTLRGKTSVANAQHVRQCLEEGSGVLFRPFGSLHRRTNKNGTNVSSRCSQVEQLLPHAPPPPPPSPPPPTTTTTTPPTPTLVCFGCNDVLFSRLTVQAAWLFFFLLPTSFIISALSLQSYNINQFGATISVFLLPATMR